MSVRQYVGARYVPRFSDVNNGNWSSIYSYEPLTIVKNGNDYYTSKKSVPIGIAITNTEYWIKTGDYNGAIAGLDTRLTAAENSITTQGADIENIKSDLAYRLYLSDFDNLSDAIAALNQMEVGGCIVIDKDDVLSDPVTITVPCTLISNSNNHTLTLNANINVLSDDFISNGIRYVIDGGSIVIGSRSLTRGLVRYSIINNTFTSDSLQQQIAINMIRGTAGNISSNMFYSDTNNNGLIAIYHDQNNANDWFQNTSITNNNFRKIYSDLYIAGHTNPEQCAGIEFCNNNSIWTTKGIHIESSDHFVISNNIIDFAGIPMYFISPNGLRLTDNYIYTETQDIVVDILCNYFMEHVIISGNFIWNRIEHSNSHITHGVKISTTNNYTAEDIVFDNNEFRNCYYCISMHCNVNGLMIHSNNFKVANTGIYLDNIYTYKRSNYYCNHTASDTSYIINGGEEGYTVHTLYVVRTANSGATELGFTIPNSIPISKIIGMVPRFPYTGYTATCGISPTENGPIGRIHFSAPLPQDTEMVVHVTYMVGY